MEAESDVDYIQVANGRDLEAFTKEYFPGDKWKIWTHPITNIEYTLTLQAAATLAPNDFKACFQLVELTSSEDYKKSKDGWNPRSKQKEMKLLDLKYLLVKRDATVEGFVSFMPTFEDDIAVLYCYEIHLSSRLRGTGFGTTLMQYLLAIGQRIPETKKLMLTVFTRNERAANFYRKLGFLRDEFSPPPRILRNGTQVDAEYVILSKPI
ncbi:hypothetical protein PZA11_006332 [Diplocarpon coronariae]|uniref:N-alpha-acetyltransferase 40 n=1 Tax=Diplocarpon coronariae TaxID=2795749 RepID=A0A218YWI9_9HELO|nr:hypothetical protein B2J93_2365 [Marssonina coronariae]